MATASLRSARLQAREKLQRDIRDLAAQIRDLDASIRREDRTYQPAPIDVIPRRAPLRMAEPSRNTPMEDFLLEIIDIIGGYASGCDIHQIFAQVQQRKLVVTGTRPIEVVRARLRSRPDLFKIDRDSIWRLVTAKDLESGVECG